MDKLMYWSVPDSVVKCPCGWSGTLFQCEQYMLDEADENQLLLGCLDCGLVLFTAASRDVSDEYDAEVQAQLKRAWSMHEDSVKLAQSRADTRKHIQKVASYLEEFAQALQARGEHHDASKLEEPEVSMFAIWGPRLAQLEYGTEEYKEALEKMGETLQLDGMTLVDLVEMVCDWRAAVQRMKNGDFRVSLAHNAKRFGIEPQLVNIIANTAREWANGQ